MFSLAYIILLIISYIIGLVVGKIVGFTLDIIFSPVRLAVAAAKKVDDVFNYLYKNSDIFLKILGYALLAVIVFILFLLYALPIVIIGINRILDKLPPVVYIEKRIDLIIKNLFIRLARLGSLVRALLWFILYMFYWPLWIMYIVTGRIFLLVYLLVPALIIILFHSSITLGKKNKKIALDPQKDKETLKLLAHIPRLGNNYKEEIENYYLCAKAG